MQINLFSGNNVRLENCRSSNFSLFVHQGCFNLGEKKWPF